MAKTGDLTSQWTYTWAVFTKLLTFHGQYPELATLFYSQAFAFSVSALSFTLNKSKHAASSAIVLCTTPVIGGMGITLWHDIPMTTGFMLTVIGAARLIQYKKSGFVYLTLGIFFSSFRYNGIPTILLFLIISWFFFERSRLLFLAIVTCLLFLSVTTFANVHYQNKISVQSEGLFDWIFYDLSCYAADYRDESFFTDNFGASASLEDWESSSACTWFNESKIKGDSSSIKKKNLVNAWRHLFFSKPFYVFELHMKRHKYLLPLPVYGIQEVPFIHTNIELPQKGITPKFPVVYESLRFYPRSWNYLSFIFAQAGFWTMILFIICLYQKDNIWYMTLTLNIILIFGLLIFAPIPDARFALFPLITGQLGLLQFFFSSIEKKFY